jgi:predicted dinucleotide-binding enzyme
LGAASS